MSVSSKEDSMYNNIDNSPYPSNGKEYEKIEDLGRGSYGHVVLSKVLSGPFKGLRVAIKILDLDNYRPEDWGIIEKELTLLQMISHPNIISSLHCFMDKSDLFLLMPYMDGGSCSQILKTKYRTGFTDEILVASILKQVLEGLVYLHGDSRIHRDIKAGNILLSMDGNVKLADFGVSRCLMEAGEKKGTAKTFTGTPCWMAPEVMHMENGYNYKADIWSFGITALEMAYGKPPLADHTPMKVLVMTLENAPPSTNSYTDKNKFSKSFRNMVDICLKKEPDRRPTAKELLRHKFIKKALDANYINEKLSAKGGPDYNKARGKLRHKHSTEGKKKMAVPIGKFNFDGVDVQQSSHRKMREKKMDKREKWLMESDQSEVDDENVKWGKCEKKGRFVILEEDI